VVETVTGTPSAPSGPLQPTAADIAIATLEAHGVETVFGVPGVHTLALYDALTRSPITHILARHEQGTGFMADGYARATGRPGVGVVITGPGVTNVATPLGEAYADSSPVFILSSNVERPYLDSMRGSLHDLKDQIGITAVLTGWNTRVMDAADISRSVSEAMHRVSSGRRLPVHVEVPLDVLDAIVADATVERTLPAGRLTPDHVCLKTRLRVSKQPDSRSCIAEAVRSPQVQATTSSPWRSD
jgi:5-guanidino-2-oxopentanoate decarboxylase